MDGGQERERAVEGPNVTAGRFWDRFLVPGGVWLVALFAIPCVLVLALSFGYVDDLGRAVYSTKTNNYADAFDPIYIPVLLRSVLFAGITTLLCLGSATRSRTTSPATAAATATR